MSISNRDLIRIFSVGTIFLVSLWFLYIILPTLGLIAAALLVTVIINPITNRIQKIMPRKNRALAVVITLLLILALLVLMVYVVIQPFISQSGQLIDSIINAIDSAKNNPDTADNYEQVSSQIAASIDSGNLTEIVQSVSSYVTDSIKGIVSFFGSFFVYMFTIISLVFFMLFDSQKVIDSVGKIFPKKHQKLYHNLSSNLFDIVARYFGGVIITAAFAGIFAYLPLAIMGIPYALALAVIVAIFDVIPYIGATIAGFIVVMFILLTGNVPAAIFMALYFLVYQQIENNVVTPLVQKSTVKLSALAVLVALMIGGAVGGIIGTLLAIPAAAFVKATYNILKQEGYIKSE